MMVNEIASHVILDEVSRLGEIGKYIIKALSILRRAEWKSLKEVTEGLAGRNLSDWNFTHALKQLMKVRVVKKEDDNYSLIDPMYSLVKNL